MRTNSDVNIKIISKKIWFHYAVQKSFREKRKIFKKQKKRRKQKDLYLLIEIIEEKFVLCLKS